MFFGPRSALSFLLLVSVAQEISAAIPDFAEQRKLRVARLEQYIEGAKETLLPGFRMLSESCFAQVMNADIASPLRTNGAVFAARIPIALGFTSFPRDGRIMVGFERLRDLSDFVGMRDQYTYVSPERLGGAAFNGMITPNNLSYAARAYLAFQGNENARHMVYRLWNTIYARYQGPQGGIIDGWNPTTNAQSDRITQASLIYPWMSSGFKIFDLMKRYDVMREDRALREKHLELLKTSTEVALKMLRTDALPVEQVGAVDLLPLTEGTYGKDKPVVILGHYAQILNFLLRSYEVNSIGNIGIRKTVEAQFRFLLRKPFINLAGGMGNGFYQDAGVPVEGWGTNMAFWQLCELAAALDRALRMNVFEDRELLHLAQDTFLKTMDTLQLYFDGVRPVAATLNAAGVAIDEDRANIPYILPYHSIDLLEQLNSR